MGVLKKKFFYLAVRFPETTLYHWGKPLANASSLTGTNAVPVVANGPSQFGEAVEIRDWDKECLTDNDFFRNNYTCIADPSTCSNDSNGISMSFFYKREIPMKDVYLKYYTRSSNANYARETLVSTGGDKQGHPGIHLWWEGPFIGVLVSTGAQYWESVFLPSLYNDTWNNIAFRWLRPQGSEKGKLEVLINVEQQAAVNFPTNAVGGTAKKALLPPTLMLGCHRDSGSFAGTLFGGGFFDEIAFWDTFIYDNKSAMFAGGYRWLAQTSMSATSSMLKGNREAWESIGEAGYKPGASKLVGSQEDYFMNLANSMSVPNDMTTTKFVDVPSDEIVSKFGVARIGYLAKSPPIVFPNYSDTIWDKGLKE
ncbi:unnamed protein product, partial [Notodromas monacha]